MKCCCLMLIACALLQLASFNQSSAQLTISTSSSTPCYGDVVTLVCHHPELANNTQTQKYYSTTVSWREDGGVITPSNGIYSKVDTAEDLTSTALNITITVDHFRKKSFNYSCSLVLADETGDASGSEKSGNVPVDPLEPESVRLKIIICLNSSITVKWFQSMISCNQDLLSYYVFWNKTSNGTLSGGNYTTIPEYTITDVTPGTYDIGVQSLVTLNNAHVYSSAVTESVESGKPQAICYTDPCLNRNFTITCLISEEHTNKIDEVYWSLDGELATGVNFTRSVNGTELYINVTAFTIGNYSCGIRLMDGTKIEGETHSVEPLDKPKSPENVTWNSTSSVLSWVHSDYCLDSLVFYFNVTWMKKGSSTVFSQTVNETNMTLYLEGDGLYNVCVTAIPTTNDTMKSEEQCEIFSQGHNGTSPIDLTNTTILAVVIPIIGVLLIAGIIIAVICVVVYVLHRRRNTTSSNGNQELSNMRNRSNDHQRNTFEQETQYLEGNKELAVRQARSTAPSTVTQREDCRAPVSEATADSEHVSSDPKVPKDQVFRDHILKALKRLGDVFEEKEKTLNQFTAVHNSAYFVAVCVHTSFDLTKDVEDVIGLKTKHSTRPTVGLLIANQDTIPPDCLSKLESNGCHFLPVGCYEQEGWEIEMVGKFKDVFPRSVDHVKPVEDLPTPVQSTSESPEKKSLKSVVGNIQTGKGIHEPPVIRTSEVITSCEEESRYTK